MHHWAVMEGIYRAFLFCSCRALSFKTPQCGAPPFGRKTGASFCCEGDPAFVVSVNCYFTIISHFCFLLPPSLPTRFSWRDLLYFASITFVNECCRFLSLLPIPDPPVSSLPPSAVTPPVFCYVGCMLPVLGLLKCVALFITL